MLNGLKSFLRRFLLPYLTLFILRLLWWSWRIEIVDPPELKRLFQEKKPFLLAHWHGDELVLMPLIPLYRLATITSTSKDGDLMNWVVAKLGGSTSRGSSTRGGVAALRGLIKLIKQNHCNVSFAVDGPKGPIYKVKPGIFEVSKLVDAPIFWAGVSVDRYHTFQKAWNKAILPLPFARIKVQWFGPMAPIPPEQDPRSSELALILENHLLKAKHQLHLIGQD